jgi:hypothetical protein
MVHNETMPPEAWLNGPVHGIPSIFQPVAHALVQARVDVAEHAPGVTAEALWTHRGAATAGFHLLHAANALDRLFTYARGELLSDAQKATLRGESADHPELDGASLGRHLNAAIDRALAQLADTEPDTAFEERRVGRSGAPSDVIGLLFHAGEHTTRHVGQFITTIKLLQA